MELVQLDALPIGSSHHREGGPAVALGVNYPEPIVSHTIARQLALDAYSSLS